MSESVETQSENKTQGLQLSGLYAYKVGMSSFFNEAGEVVPVTVLKYEPMIVSQVKTVEKDGYSAVQLSARPKRASRTSDAEKGHLKGSGFENGAMLTKEVRQELPEGVAVGQKLSLESFAIGDLVKVTARTKGRGFAGVHKRWSFAGGPATHGSGFHRRPGSVGNRTWPGRVIPGKKLPGHYGDETVTVKNLKIIDVNLEDSVLLVSGAVPGARNTLVKLMKV